MEKRCIGRKSKKAQIMGMPFQFIFSIILIAIFLFVAVVVIKTVIQTTQHSQTAKFENELIAAVEEMWLSTSAAKTYDFYLPSSIEYICFSQDITKWEKDMPLEEVYDDIKRVSDDSDARQANFFFYPQKILYGFQMSPYIDITCEKNQAECLDLSNLENPYCIKNAKGIKITFEKDIGKDVKIKAV